MKNENIVQGIALRTDLAATGHFFTDSGYISFMI